MGDPTVDSQVSATISPLVKIRGSYPLRGKEALYKLSCGFDMNLINAPYVACEVENGALIK